MQNQPQTTPLTNAALSSQLQQELAEHPELQGWLQSPALTIVVSLSGGLDSVALLLWAKQYYPAARIIAHHQAIIEDWYSAISYNRAVCQRLNIPLFIHQGAYIHRLRQFKNGKPEKWQWSMQLTEIPSGRDHPYDRVEAAHLYGIDDPNLVCAGILDMAEARGWPPSSGNRWCTALLKRDTFNCWARQNRPFLGENSVVLIGYRRAESASRAKQPIARLRNISLNPGHEIWPNGWRMYDYHPILDWAKQDTVNLLLAHNIQPHVAYKAQGLNIYGPVAEGGPRFSCCICIYSNGCHAAQGVKFQPDVPAEETDHARRMFRRVFEFQRDTGLTWQMAGASGFNQVAQAMGEDTFEKPPNGRL